MKHYPQEKWLFGNDCGPSETPGIWTAKDNHEKAWDIEIADSEELLDNDDIMAMIIFFRRMKADSLNSATQLLQKNQIDGNLADPHLLMEDEDSENYLKHVHSYQKSVAWLPLLETEARQRNLHGELNANIF